MAIQQAGDAAGVERRIGKITPPCLRHRDVDIGRRAGGFRAARSCTTGRDQRGARPLWSAMTGPRTLKRGTAGDAARWVGSRAVVGMAANPLVPTRSAVIGPAA
jgi:hypothetical protein